MKLKYLFLAVGLTAVFAAEAHHSAAAIYDLMKEVTVTGTVTKLQLGNPHMRLYFDVKTGGATEEWVAEGGSRTVLQRKGWTTETVKPGDKISVRGHPSRDGSHTIHMAYLILPDGKEIYAEDIDPKAIKRRTRAAEDQPK